MMKNNWLKKIVLVLTLFGMIVGATACSELIGPIINEMGQAKNTTSTISPGKEQGGALDYQSIIAPDGEEKQEAESEKSEKSETQAANDSKKSDEQTQIDESYNDSDQKSDLIYGESYTSVHEVAAYLFEFEELPPNFITKNEAYDLGWEPREGNLPEVAPGYSIGGDRFGNREGLLPEAPGRQYYECDIDYEGGTRNAKRIVYSNDGLIFYTDDHYASFEQLY